MRLDVNVDGAIQLTARLERINRSAFPLAVRSTLNDLAFDMKQKELGKSFNKKFKPKKGTINLYKKLIRVEKASGFKVNEMNSVVGLLNPSRSVDKRFVEGMSKQESGGVIDNGFRYLKYARAGGELNNRVIIENIYDKKKIITGRSKRKGTRKSKFVARAFRALKEDKPMFLNTMRGNFLVKVNTVSSNISDKKLNFDFSFIAMNRRKNKTNLKGRHVVRDSQLETIKKVINFYEKNANYQFNRALRQ